MPVDEEANARSQPAKGLLSLQRQRQLRDGAADKGRWWDRDAVPRQQPPYQASSCSQVGHSQPEAAPRARLGLALPLHGKGLPLLPQAGSLQGSESPRVALPRSTVAREVTPTRTALPPFPTQAVAHRRTSAAQAPGAASTSCKLPAFLAAASASRERAMTREMATGTVPSRQQQLTPAAGDIHHGAGTAATLESRRPSPPSRAAYAASVRGTPLGPLGEVRVKGFAGSRGLGQQLPVTQQDWAHRPSVRSTASPGKSQVAERSKASKAQPVPEPHARGVICVTIRTPMPAFGSHQAALSIQLGHPEKAERSCMAHSGHRQDHANKLTVQWQQALPEKTKLQKGKEEQKGAALKTSKAQLDLRSLTDCQVNSYNDAQPEQTRVEHQMDDVRKKGVMECLEDRAPSAQQSGAAGLAVQQEMLEDTAGALAELEDWEEDNGKELSQDVNDITVTDIWQDPFFLELLQELDSGPQEEPGSSSSTVTEVAAEEAGDMQSRSSVPAGLTDAAPAALALDGAPEAGPLESQEPAPYSPRGQGVPLLPQAGSSQGSGSPKVVVPRIIVTRVVSPTRTALPPFPTQAVAPQHTSAAQSQAIKLTVQWQEGEEEQKGAALKTSKGKLDLRSLTDCQVNSYNDGQPEQTRVEHQMDDVRKNGMVEYLEDRAPSAQQSGAAGLAVQQEMLEDTAGGAEEAGDMQSKSPVHAPAGMAPAQKRRPSFFRRMLKAVRRAFRGAFCMTALPEQ